MISHDFNGFQGVEQVSRWFHPPKVMFSLDLHRLTLILSLFEPPDSSRLEVSEASESPPARQNLGESEKSVLQLRGMPKGRLRAAPRREPGAEPHEPGLWALRGRVGPLCGGALRRPLGEDQGGEQRPEPRVAGAGWPWWPAFRAGFGPETWPFPVESRSET